ncbi:nucleolar protein 56-like isoform X2 [Pseudophryne corroboree]|uniref:nucleolar protein 56-like isoform X2 n=1 Tax=Pseudophryne corroboree TaxID=495146 RepID=UPI003081D1EC
MCSLSILRAMPYSQCRRRRRSTCCYPSIVKLVAYSPFMSSQSALENVNAINKGVLHEDLKLFLETNMPAERQKVLLGVSHSKIGDAIEEKLNITCQMGGVVAMLMKGVWLYFSTLLNGYAAQSASKAKLGPGHSYTRSKVNEDQEDNMIIQSIGLLDQLDKDINTFSMKVREWYSRHFPELLKIVPNSSMYCRMVRFIGNRKELSEEKLVEMEEIVMDRAKAQAILDASRSSKGMDISPVELVNIESFTSQIISSSEKWKSLQECLRSKMSRVAPSLCALIGEVVGARLISHAGSLGDLAKLPASTIQIFGAKKSVFREKRVRGKRWKNGLIFHSPVIERAPAKDKIRLSRFLATQCMLAARMDFFSENPTSVYGDKMREQVEEKLVFFKTGKALRKEQDVMKDAQPEASDVTAMIMKKMRKRESRRINRKNKSMKAMVSGMTAKMKQKLKKKEQMEKKQEQKRMEAMGSEVTVEIEQKLKKKEQKKKKREKKRLEAMVTEEDNEPEDNEPSPDRSREEEEEPSKKKKKWKSEGDVLEIGLEEEVEQTPPKRRKKKKSAPEDSTASEVTVEIMREPETKDWEEKEEEKRLQVMVTEEDIEAEDNEPSPDRDEEEKPSKRKRKRKSEGNITENGIEEEQTTSKRKMKKSAPKESTASEGTVEINRKLEKKEQKKKKRKKRLEAMVTEEDDDLEDNEPSLDRSGDEEEEVS